MFGMKKRPGKFAGEPRDRFKIDVTENIATSGLDSTKSLKYRWMITDTKTGEPVKVGYNISIKEAWRVANVKLTKLIRNGG